MIVAVTGGRNVRESYFVASRLSALHVGYCFNHVVHGAAKSGVDLFTHYWCRQAHVIESACPVEPHEWEQYGKMAGNIRNERMLRTWQPTMLFAFPGGSGTADCIERADALGIEVLRICR